MDMLQKTIFIFLILCIKVRSANGRSNNTPICLPDMFKNDTNGNAFLACQTLDAFQNNWFPSPIAGLFTYLDWNGFTGFWQNGAVLQPLVDYIRYTNSTRYRKTLLSSWRPIIALKNAYATPSCDDELWFGLSFASIYDLTGEKLFLETAQDVFNMTWDSCWDTDNNCNAGWYFGGGKYKKITITNSQGLLLSAQLYRFTNNVDYLKKSLQTLNYFTTNQILNLTTYLVSDRLNLTSCQPDMRQNLTYNAGVLMGGLIELFKGTHNETYLEMAHKIATAMVWHSSFNGIFTEYCDFDQNCENDGDAKMFKGIFLAHLRHLLDYSNSSQAYLYRSWIQYNINNVLRNAKCTSEVSKCNINFIDGKPKVLLMGPIWNENWHGPFVIGGPQQQTSVLSLFISGILPNVTCKPEHMDKCNYDPVPPDIKKLTCTPNPCPVGHECCPLDNKYFTCCEKVQSCYAGGCYPP